MPPTQPSREASLPIIMTAGPGPRQSTARQGQHAGPGLGSAPAALDALGDPGCALPSSVGSSTGCSANAVLRGSLSATSRKPNSWTSPAHHRMHAAPGNMHCPSGYGPLLSDKCTRRHVSCSYCSTRVGAWWIAAMRPAGPSGRFSQWQWQAAPRTLTCFTGLPARAQAVQRGHIALTRHCGSAQRAPGFPLTHALGHLAAASIGTPRACRCDDGCCSDGRSHKAGQRPSHSGAAPHSRQGSAGYRCDRRRCQATCRAAGHCGHLCYYRQAHLVLMS